MPPFAIYNNYGDEFLHYTPVAFVAAGTPTLVANAIWGVCQKDVNGGETAAFRIRGVFRAKKADAGVSMNAGTYLDFTAGVGFSSGGSTWQVVATSPAGDEYVCVRINATDSGVGTPGADGREVEIQNSGTYLQWRYVGDVSWTNIVSIASLQGASGAPGADGADGTDGQEVALRATATDLEWQYVGGTWTQLIALADLVPNGDRGDITVSGGTWTIDPNVVTFAKMQDIGTNIIVGRVSAGTGDPEQLTAAQVRSIINVEDGADVTDSVNVDAAGAVMNSDASTAAMSFVIDEDSFATNSATKVPTQQSVKAYVDAAVSAGLGDGDKGDITVSGSGLTWTIDAGAVTFGKIQNVSTGILVGRLTAGSGVLEQLTAANVRTLINVEDGADVTDAANVDAAGAVMNSDTTTASMSFVIDEDSFVSNSATKVPTQQSVKAYVDASISAATIPDGDKGDITVTASGLTWTIDADAVTFAKMQNIATASILGRTAVGTGDIQQLDAADVRTLINVENGADVTDAANVDAAGAVMNSDTSTAAMSFVIDEDSFATNSATKVPTQQSVKAYVDGLLVDEVKTSGAPYTGPAPTGAQLGGDYTNRRLYIVDGAGNWKPLASDNTTITDGSLATPGSPVISDITAFRSAQDIHGPTIIRYVGSGTSSNPDYVWYVGDDDAISLIRQPLTGLLWSRYTRVSAASHSFISGDIGKPIQANALYSPFAADVDPRGIIQAIVDANTIDLAVIGDNVDLSNDLLGTGVQVNDVLDWDSGTTKYVRTRPAGINPYAPYILRVNSLGASTFNATVLVG